MGWKLREVRRVDLWEEEEEEKGGLGVRVKLTILLLVRGRVRKSLGPPLINIFMP